jgi:hypothetical protein
MLAVQHRMAQRDIQQLYQLNGEEFDRSEPRNKEIERNYNAIYDATHYVFETFQSNREISHEWLRTRLIFFANAAQAFSQDVWAEISQNSDDSQDITIQALMTTRTNDAIAFLQTADSERQREQAIHRRNLKNWTAEKQVGALSVQQMDGQQNQPGLPQEDESRTITVEPKEPDAVDVAVTENPEQRTTRILVEALQASQQQDLQRGSPKLKLVNPKTYDGKPTTPFRPWWESVKEFLRFYPNTAGYQRVIWVGTLLTNEALEWHQARRRQYDDTDSWEAYSTALQKEYLDPREPGLALQKMWTLRYKGDIKAYFTSFRALNLLAKATGEPLQDMVNRAMPSEILHMRFAHNFGIFTEDEPFLDATYEAGRQVELEKSLLKHTEGTSRVQTSDAKDTERRTLKNRRDKDYRSSAHESSKYRQEGKPQGKDRWESIQAALIGVPEQELVEHRKNKEGCLRCGRTGHRCLSCYARTTTIGTPLPPMNATNAARVASAMKRRSDTDDQEDQPRKQAQTAAVSTVDDSEPPSAWAEESEDEEDF